MNNEHTIPAVEKAVALLAYLGNSSHGATQAELARELGITPSTCYRIIQTLQKHDWLRKVGGNRFDLSAGMLATTMKLANQAARFEVCRPLLEKLANQTGLSAKLSIRQGNDQISLIRAESPNPVSISGREGARFPVIEGSVGAVLLYREEMSDIEALAAGCKDDIDEKKDLTLVRDRIEEVRRHGYCFNAKANRWRIDALSVPLSGEDGEVLAAITLLGFDDDFSPACLEKLLTAMKSCAAGCLKAI